MFTFANAGGMLGRGRILIRDTSIGLNKSVKSICMRRELGKARSTRREKNNKACSLRPTNDEAQGIEPCLKMGKTVRRPAVALSGQST